MFIRRSDLGEREGIAQLISRAFLTSPVFAGIEDERYSLKAVTGKLAKGETWIAVELDQLVGSITLFPPDPNSACEAFRYSPQFGLLAVDPTWIGKGLGRLLVAAIENEARSRGHAYLALSVTQRGKDLIALYRRLGYGDVGEFHWLEAVDPSLIMRKAL